jgi:DNA-binding MarR family transcriptional regulator/GNAT superfamily N-acetyltransferase
MAESELDRRIAAVRRFNRFYTRSVGLLEEGYLKSAFSLSEARVLYELAHRETPTAGELARDLGLDAGYLSRILRRFEKRRLLVRSPGEDDGRRRPLSLTAKGQLAFAPLDRRSREDIGAMLAGVSVAEQERLVDAMGAIEAVMGAKAEPRVPYLLRPHRPGDMGWVVHRHGALYAEEYAFDERFEALVAEIVARFIHRYDPRKERCWIAERDGKIVGSVFLVRRSATVAQLRLLLVEPSARGLGIGARLVEECIRFGRQTRYRKITLWTNSILLAARRIYEKAGFTLVASERHRSFGHALVGETWELRL